MKQLNEHHTFTGMQQDLDIALHPAQFLYHAKNVRLTPRNGDTLFAISNEKGTENTTIELTGDYLGHCLLNNYLVVFTHDEGAEYPDYIYRIDLSGEEILDKTVLYNGNLGFSMEYPIETVASYENTLIQKVYWTDSLNQPRVINIVGETDGYNDDSFDFVRTLKLEETVVVEKLLGATGAFAPGVIQYAFTYYTKYGQESNIFYTTPLMYISYKDRGASPEDKVDNAFKIIVNDPDTNFDYLRIYSIHRTSLNGTPIVKRVTDLSIKNYEKQDPTSPDFPYDYIQSSSIYFRSNPGENYINISSAGAKFRAYKITGTLHITEGLTTVSYTGTWYKFTRQKFPNMQLKVEDGFVSWDPNGSNDQVLWANDYPITIGGVRSFIAIVTSNEGSTSGSDVYLTAVKTVYDKAIVPSSGLTFIDTGVEGDSVDPAELLYKGGESITAKTLEQKDNTLFLGNIGVIRPQIDSTIKDGLLASTGFSLATRAFKAAKISDGAYSYANQLTSFEAKMVNNNWLISNKTVPCGGFKKKDYYRLGVQFQHKSGKWSDPVYLTDYQITNSPELAYNNPDIIKVPTIRATISNIVAAQLIGKDYTKARAVVVFPDIQDRVTICQGVVCPTVECPDANTATVNNKINKIQSSWFWRPTNANDVQTVTNLTACLDDNTIEYTNYATLSNPYNPQNMRRVEIQGQFSTVFSINKRLSTFHSPDVEFDTNISTYSFSNVQYRKNGYVKISKVMSDINIQTDTPTISNLASGFDHQTYVSEDLYPAHGFVAGLFYDDFLVDDDDDTYKAFSKEGASIRPVIYPWQKDGSLNNDVERPANKGIGSSILKKKILSNLRYTNTTYYSDYPDPIVLYDCLHEPQVFSSDVLSILKTKITVDSNDREVVYQGNIDTVLNPSDKDGMYFGFGGTNIIDDTDTNVYTENWWKTFGKVLNQTQQVVDGQGIYKWNSSDARWDKNNDLIGNVDTTLVMNKGKVRMKYKSTPHIILPFNISYPSNTESKTSKLNIVELVNKGDSTGWRNTMFGGNTSYGNPIPSALQSNVWVPCGEPVPIRNTDGIGGTQGDVVYYYSYGDTYYQRWDCLKTYPFTKEDVNQIVEIGSFMLETHVNIDGRYDRNRGQLDNTNMSPENFNLLNPVYSQVDNFFSYRILDEQYYNIDRFPNEITWTKEKAAGAEIDAWTNITLGSTYDMDGSKGEVISLNLWRDNIYCFQNKGVSNILFNSRVQIPTSDGVPIEISNSYKVDGYRYLSDGVGCKDARLIKETPAGVYFMDSISSHLYYIGDGLQDVSATHNMTSWFNQNGSSVKKLLYDDVNKDIYLVRDDDSMCYSELLGQFTGFYDYDDIKLIESWDKKTFTMRATMRAEHLYRMFNGDYNYFFNAYKPWEFTFVSNGADQSMQDFDKIFTNVDYRMDIQDSNGYAHDATLDYLRVWNEYQDTRVVELGNKNGAVRYTTYPQNYVGSNVQKKFRIWRLQIPRTKKEKTVEGVTEWVNTNDRIRNTWCKVSLGRKTLDASKAILHDLNVQYYV